VGIIAAGADDIARLERNSGKTRNNFDQGAGPTMRSKPNYLSAVLVTGLAAVAIVVAPVAATATAAPNVRTCVNKGPNTTLCESPGNAEINNQIPVDARPQYPFWIGRGGFRR